MKTWVKIGLKTMLAISLMNTNPTTLLLNDSIAAPPNSTRNGTGNRGNHGGGHWDKEYHGYRSIKLDSDPIYKERRRTAEDAQKVRKSAKINLDAVKASKNAKKTELDGVNANITKYQAQKTLSETNINNGTNGLANLNRQMVALKRTQTAAQVAYNNACPAASRPGCNATAAVQLQAVRSANRAVTLKTRAIATLNTQIAAQRRLKAQAVAQLTVLRPKVQPLRNALSALGTRVTSLQGRFYQATTSATTSQKSFDDYSTELRTVILRANNRGHHWGIEDGGQEGMEAAVEVGNREGYAQGEYKGRTDGTNDGQTRDYNSGKTAGFKVGEGRADLDGERDGTREGKIAGNNDAADREGTSAGTDRASKSDAALKGTSKGNGEGATEAASVGKTRGNATGQAQAIDKYENQETLSDVKIDGNFAGNYNRRRPDYPGFGNMKRTHWDHDHDRDHRRGNGNRFKRRLAQKAFKDGYNYGYEHQSEYIFNQNINAIFNFAYDEALRISYNTALTTYYANSFNSGKTDGDNEAYGIQYPQVKKSYFDSHRITNNNNPDRNSSEFRSTYSSVEAAKYASDYNWIKEDRRGKAFTATYNNNLPGEIEKNRVIKKSEVEGIYESSAVLKYVSSSIYDGGVESGIAKNDGVYQPGEAVLHTVTIKNFGKAQASNVKVSISGGTEITIPAIAAQSIVTIKGAAKSSVSNSKSAGASASKVVTVYSKGGSNQNITKRHYSSSAQGQLNSGDQQAIRVAYPLSLDNLALSGQLLFNKPNSVSASLVNRSKRAYSGDIKIELSLRGSSNPIITKQFSSVGSLSKSATAGLRDAEVFVSSKDDLYRPLTISAVIKKSGVIIGYSNNINAMAKSAYENKAGAIVLAMNAEKSTRDLLDYISNAGGLEKVSVLDLSIPSLNQDVLRNGLQNKVVLLNDSGDERELGQLSNVLAKSQDSAFLFVGNRTDGLEWAKTNLSSLANSVGMSLVLPGFSTNVGVRSTNKFMGSSVSGTSFMIQSSNSNYEDLLGLASMFTKSAADFSEEIAANMNSSEYLNPSESKSVAIKVFNAKAIMDVLAIGEAYAAKGKKEKKALPKIMQTSDQIFLNQFKNSLTRSAISNDNAVKFAMAFGASYAVDKALDQITTTSNKGKPISSTLKSKGVSESRKNLENAAKAKLKAFNEDFYDDAKDSKTSKKYLPFIATNNNRRR